MVAWTRSGEQGQEILTPRYVEQGEDAHQDSDSAKVEAMKLGYRAL